MSKKHNKPNKPRWDDKWMNQLLAEPEVAVQIADFTPRMLDFYKRMLYQDGVYQRYVLEQQKKQIKDAVHENLPALIKDS